MPHVCLLLSIGQAAEEGRHAGSVQKTAMSSWYCCVSCWPLPITATCLDAILSLLLVVLCVPVNEQDLCPTVCGTHLVSLKCRDCTASRAFVGPRAQTTAVSVAALRGFAGLHVTSWLV